MPGQMVASLHGVQGGDEGAFARLYAETNPVILRYLRVISDRDPAALALTTWATLLHVMPGFDADEDDDWLELTVGTARLRALAASEVTPAPDAAPVIAPAVDAGAASDPFADVVAALRACGPATADVLAMHVVAGLGRDSIARITGQEPTEVLALVHQGQGGLGVPVEGLVAAARRPGTPAELADLPAALDLFAARFQLSSPTKPYADSAEPSTGLPLIAAPTLASTPPPAGAGGSPGSPTVVDLLSGAATAPTTSRVVLRHTVQQGGTSRLTRAGAGAAAWAVAIGGVGMAAAMSGVIPAAIDNIFGDDGRRPPITAEGPTRPGTVPSEPEGGEGVTPPPSEGQNDPQDPGVPDTVSPPVVGDDVVVDSATGTTTRVVLVSTVVVVSPATGPSPTTPPTPTTPGGPGAKPPEPAPQPPPAPGRGDGGRGDGNGQGHGGRGDGNREGQGGRGDCNRHNHRHGNGHGNGNGNGHAYGKGHPKHSTGQAKGRDKADKAKAAAAKKAAAKKAALARARAAAQARATRHVV